MVNKMKLGKVSDTVVSTRKLEKLVGYKLLVVAVLDENRAETAERLVAIDCVGAGTGETVIITQGANARYACSQEDVPIDASIVGIVDRC